MGRAKEDWLKTFHRVIAALDPGETKKGFVAWVSSIAKLTVGEVVSIDGKNLLGARERGKRALVHMVSGWANNSHLVVGTDQSRR